MPEQLRAALSSLPNPPIIAQQTEAQLNSDLAQGEPHKDQGKEKDLRAHEDRERFDSMRCALYLLFDGILKCDPQL